MRVGLLIGMILSCKDDDFGDYALGRTSSASTISELDEYLRLPTVKTNDPLAWWQDNRRTYPTLHWMALDFLSVPGWYFIHI